MDLNLELRLRTQHLPPSAVLHGMGYREAAPDTLEHYRAVLDGRYMGLERKYRDERYGEWGFLEALCRCVGLDEADYHPTIAAVSERLAEDRAAFRHWLFADTDYVRRTNPTTPIFAMAFTEHLRRLTFPIDFWRLPWEERLAAACQRARNHMQESGGRLVTWGEIKRYHYCYAEGHSVVISPKGEVIGERTSFEPSKATLGLAGSDENLGDLFADDTE